MSAGLLEALVEVTEGFRGAFDPIQELLEDVTAPTGALYFRPSA